MDTGLDGTEGVASVLGYYASIGELILVEMGDVDFVDFDVKLAIGTGGLSGCSVALVASPYGAILAHIPPRPNLSSSDPHAGDANTAQVMAAFYQLYQDNISYFSDTPAAILFVQFSDSKRHYQTSLPSYSSGSRPWGCNRCSGTTMCL